MKYIIVVPDGMADYPVEILGNKTPLEVAHRQNMDYLASKGMTGLIQTIPLKMSPGSDIGNLSIMGYDPHQHFTGRAPLEAANLGIILKDDEVAFRCNLVTIVDEKMIDYSAGHISTKEAEALINELNKKLGTPNIKFYPGKSYRHIMVIKSPHFKELLKLKSTAPHDILEQNISSHLLKGEFNEELLALMERSKDIFLNHSINQVRIDLKENPATQIWLWGQGNRPNLPSFTQKFGLQGSIISAVDLVNGIGRLAGLDVIKVPNITGYYDTNYVGKAEYAMQSLKNKDFVFIHIEAPDEAGHNGDIKMKISCIERIDKEIIGTILKHFEGKDNFRILILPDHATPVEKRCHVGDPVGFVMYGRGVSPDGSTEYTETSTKEKGLRFKSGEELMNYFITHNRDLPAGRQD